MLGTETEVHSIAADGTVTFIARIAQGVTVEVPNPTGGARIEVLTGLPTTVPTPSPVTKGGQP